MIRGRRAGKWCTSCSRRHTPEMGCGGDATCAACERPATRRLRMRQVDVDTDAETGQELRRGASSWMVPFCEACGPGSQLKQPG